MSIEVIEKMKMYYPAITPVILKEKRKLSILQRYTNGKTTLVTGVPIFDDSGRITRVICNAKDLDEINSVTKYLNESSTGNGKQDDKIHSHGKNLIIASNVMKRIMNSLVQVAKADSTVLITGESGVGKDVVAHYIHENSPRVNHEFVHINCGAIPEPLLESELFGYESGAFTGAKKSGKTGLIEVANKGTLFLDEIAEMPANLQVKLLQVLQTKCVTRVGGTEPIDVDVRIISATNKDLGKLVKTGKFRLDLYYRLNVIPVHVPPLRERKDDIMPLAENFLERLNKRYQKNVQLMPDVIQVMLNYSWPGNIRELENLIERIVVVSTKNKITIEDLPYISHSLYVDKPVVVNKVIPLNQAINDLEQQMVSLAYKKCKNSYKLGKILGISQSSAHRKIKKYIKESNEKEYNSSVNYSNPPMN